MSSIEQSHSESVNDNVDGAITLYVAKTGLVNSADELENEMPSALGDLIAELLHKADYTDDTEAVDVLGRAVAHYLAESNAVGRNENPRETGGSFSEADVESFLADVALHAITMVDS